jgi:hypothetical protein
MAILRFLATLLCGPMVVVGGVWILQGINLLPGSFMTGDPKWAVFGVALGGVGLALATWVNRRRPV